MTTEKKYERFQDIPLANVESVGVQCFVEAGVAEYLNVYIYSFDEGRAPYSFHELLPQYASPSQLFTAVRNWGWCGEISVAENHSFVEAALTENSLSRIFSMAQNDVRELIAKALRFSAPPIAEANEDVEHAHVDVWGAR